MSKEASAEPVVGEIDRPDSPPDGTSADLLARAKQGESGAWEALFGALVPPLRRWAHGRLPRWARGAIDTVDLVQEALLNTLHNLTAFEPRRRHALRAYLRRAVENRIRDEVRRIGRRPALDPLASDHVDAGPSPQQEAEAAEVLGLYRAALAGLRPEERLMVVARMEMQLSFKQVALLAETTPEAARKVVERALERMAREMGRG